VKGSGDLRTIMRRVPYRDNRYLPAESSLSDVRRRFCKDM